MWHSQHPHCRSNIYSSSIGPRLGPSARLPPPSRVHWHTRNIIIVQIVAWCWRNETTLHDIRTGWYVSAAYLLECSLRLSVSCVVLWRKHMMIHSVFGQNNFDFQIIISEELKYRFRFSIAFTSVMVNLGFSEKNCNLFPPKTLGLRRQTKSEWDHFSLQRKFFIYASSHTPTCVLWALSAYEHLRRAPVVEHKSKYHTIFYGHAGMLRSESE